MDDDRERRREDPFASAVSRLGERVAALEARASAEIAALKDDTAHIRHTQHEVANTIQGFIATSSTNQLLLTEHLKICDTRSARLERIAWGVMAGVVAVLGLLLKIHFFPTVL